MVINAAEQLVLTRHRNTVVGDDRQLRRAAQRGELTRLLNGAYVSTAVWTGLSKDDRHRLAAAAAAAMNPAFVASHRTAAALWGLPVIGRADGLVHARTSRAAGSRTEHGFRKHAVVDPDLHLAEVEGITATTVERTVLDLAATESFASAVAAADHALRTATTRSALYATLAEWAPGRGRAGILRVLDFADAASGSAGESYSRCEIAAAGLPAPLLQVRFDDRDGLIGYVDFYWPEYALIGEFDGLEKYSAGRYLAGRTPSDIVVAEKVREDRLRAHDSRPGVTRWTWSTVHARGALARQLRDAGLRNADAGVFGGGGRERTPA